ncbi:carboxylate methylbutanoyltransferase [Cladobotryum mycophilum]|uniref:Carboxylate methylbutanoyltransferase n=1 Tax=Cladobotryum mycophilum TaxID=491253 RepID=A0ABR0SHN2_9HYPO
MAQRIDKVYEDAVASGLLPGVSVFAGNKDGEVIYSKSLGKASLQKGREDDFTPSTLCGIASMSKLMTAVAVLQCVEQGKLDLDENLRPRFPEMGQYGIITGFDEQDKAIFKSDSTPISLRTLLSYTSGHEYDWANPLLGKWRSQRNEGFWHGRTIEEKTAIPLTHAPGTRFTYGGHCDWAGKVIQVAMGMSLDEFMRIYIWTPLRIEKDASFYPKTNPGMKDRIADTSTLNEKGEGPAMESDFDILFGGTDCFGGAGIFASAEAYYTFLSAVFRRDSRLLTPESYTELFRPQLNETTEQAFNDYLYKNPMLEQYLALGIPRNIRKTWCFAGMICLSGQEGRFEKGTTFWAGAMCCKWFMDHEAGVCGTALCQVIPPMHPAIMSLHEEFQRGVLEIAKSK